MSDEQIYCPACNHKLRVPADLLGQPVECPQCHARFTAPIRPDAAPQVRAADGPAADYAHAYADDREAREYRGRGLLTAPAVCLLVIGVLALGTNGYIIANGLLIQANPALFEQELQNQLDKNPGINPKQRQEIADTFTADFFAGLCKWFGGLSLAAALLTVFGAIAMLARRMYWLAVLGAIAALNPINCCCLDLNVPFAIWASWC